MFQKVEINFTNSETIFFSGNRRKIIIEDGCFPSDYWICRSHIEMSGNNPDEDLVVIKPRPGELLINDDDIINKIRELGKYLTHATTPRSLAPPTLSNLS